RCEGEEPGHAMRLSVQDTEMGTPRAISPEGITIWGKPISPDGKFFAAINPEQKISIYPVEGGEPRQLSGIEAGDLPIRWSADGRSIYLYRFSDLPAKVYRLDLSTGRKEIWKELQTSD